MSYPPFTIENGVPLPDMGPSGLGKGYRSDLQNLSAPETSRVVSRAFRDYVLERYPALREDVSLLRGVEYLMFSANIHPDWHSLRACCRNVAGFEGKAYKCAQNNYGDIERYLMRLRDTLLPGLSWTPYDKEEKECRRIKSTGFPADVEEVLKEERSTPISQLADPVYFTDGRKANRANRSEMVKLSMRDVETTYRRAASDEVREALQYLNNLPLNSFSKLLGKMEEAYALANGLPDRATRSVCDTKRRGKNRRRPTRVDLYSMSPREVALRALRAIEENPKPLYDAGERTTRITAVGLNLTNVDSKIRGVLTEGWVEYDLKSAQLAVNCADWGVEDVCDFLSTGQNVWSTLMGDVFPDLPPSDDLKRIVKEAVYSVSFGKREGAVKSTMTCRLNRYLSEHAIGRGGIKTAELSRRFVTHWIVRALLDAREARFNQIERDSGIEDAFGNWISLTGDVDARSVLAQRAQSVEMALILPVYRLAKTTKDFTVILHQHDGFSVAFRSNERKARWAGRIECAVLEEAQRRRIPTQLEIKSV